MNAAAALVEYGYELQDDGSYMRSKGDGIPRDKWEPVDGGFLRFTRSDGAWKPVAYTIGAGWEGVSGLSTETHPQCFAFVYPEDYVLGVYADGIEARNEALAEHAARRAEQLAAEVDG